jgi:hypothetical protein
MAGARLVQSETSQFRIEKQTAQGTLFLSNGTSVIGRFFVAGGSATHAGPERVRDVLNAEPGFFPFEVVSGDGATRTILYNREHVLFVELPGSVDPRLDTGYNVAIRRNVAMLFPGGMRLHGMVSVHRPQGSDRLSDFARSSAQFQYLETADATYLVNVRHLIELGEETS